MRNTNQLVPRRGGFTLIELIVVIGIILVIAALGAAFAPTISDSQNLTRSVDNLEQWLLTAKMRAKRDGLATGIRFIPPDPLNPTVGPFSEFQYIQQPDAMTGGTIVFVPNGSNPPAGAAAFQVLPAGTLYVTGGICLGATANTATGVAQVQFGNVDFFGGHALPVQYLVQPGDYLELRDGGVYLIGQAVATPSNPTQSTILQLGGNVAGTVVATQYDLSVSVSSPTTNYRILRQPRILIGEPPLTMPTNMVVDMNAIPGTTMTSNVVAGPSGYLEILFSPSGAVVGTNAGSGKILLCVRDSTDLSYTDPITNLQTYDPNKAGIVGVQCRTGFIGAYSVAPGADPFYYAEEGRSSGL